MTSPVSHVDTWRRSALLRIAIVALLLVSIADTAMAFGKHRTLPAPVDLGADGREAVARGKPIVILFSLPGCSFCDVVRQNYLSPMLRDLPEKQQPLIREIQVAGSDKFVDFNGERISHHAFAMRYKVRFAPTVVFLDSAGKLLTSPLVGGDTTGLYGGYLDNALAEAARKINDGRPATTSGK